MAKEYSDFWKDPRWQQCRLRILQRDNWKCQNCGSSVKELQVHHFYYERGRKPWEQGPQTMTTYCRECHEVAEDWVDFFKKNLLGNPNIWVPIRNEITKLISNVRTATDMRKERSEKSDLKQRILAATSHEEAIKLLGELRQ